MMYAIISKHFGNYFAGFILVVILFFLLASWGVFGSLPDETSLENPEKNLATEIISSDGKTIGKFYKENRTPVPFEALPDHLVNALVATEDARFYEHSGIDGKGTITRSCIFGNPRWCKYHYPTIGKIIFYRQVHRNKLERVLQKIKEWIIATRLERRYTKEEIITMYFNEYDFLNQAVGIESAANIYFDKPPSELDHCRSLQCWLECLKILLFIIPVRRPELVRETEEMWCWRKWRNTIIFQKK